MWFSFSNKTIRMKKIIPLIAFLAIISCNKDNVFHKFDKDFESNRWSKLDIKKYDFEISEPNKYDVILEFSHIYDYDMETIPFVINIQSPDGTETNEKLELPIKDKSGKHLADCSGDICDLKYVLKPNYDLEKGNYSISISNTSKFGFLPNVLGVGLKVKKSKN